MNFIPKSKLPRLSREYYQGHAVVFWTHTLEDRATGWLDERFHAGFRELLLHTCARYSLACPVYVLMPDHWHAVWMGCARDSDQRLATAFFRKHAVALLHGAKLQDRAHDHVLREDERKRNAFMAACHYVAENAVRKSLVQDWRAWKFLGAVVPGYPDLDPREEVFWDKFWKIYNRKVDLR